MFYIQFKLQIEIKDLQRLIGPSLVFPKTHDLKSVVLEYPLSTILRTYDLKASYYQVVFFAKYVTLAEFLFQYYSGNVLLYRLCNSY